MSNDYCFDRAAHVLLSQCNRRNTSTALRVVVKSHKDPTGTRRILKNFSTFAGKNPPWSPFIIKLQPAIAYKKSQSKDYSVNSIKKETPTPTVLDKYFL